MHIKRRLNKAASDFLREITSIAAEARREVVVPFCRKYDLRFASVNGDCYFLRGDEILYTAEFDAQRLKYKTLEPYLACHGSFARCRLRGATRVARTLLTQIPIYDDAVPGYSQHLHAFMADYDPHTRKNRRPR